MPLSNFRRSMRLRPGRVSSGAAAAPTVTSVTPSSGFAAGSTAVTVAGTNFVATPSVTIGGVACTAVVFVSSISLTCTTGVHAAGLVNCIVTNPDTQTGTGVGVYTYVAAPTVSAISPDLGDIDGGVPVTITGTAFVATPTVAIGGVACTSVVWVNSTTLTAVTGAKAVTVGCDVVVTNPDTQAGTGAALFEYWDPTQVTGIQVYLDSNKGVTDAGSGHVSAWLDQGPNARNFLQATDALRPIQTAALFGALPGIRFTPQQRVALAVDRALVAGLSIFAVAKWTSTDAVTDAAFGGVPLAIVSEATTAFVSFGVSAGEIDYNQYIAGDNETKRGSGLNDGAARLIGVTHDHTSGDAKLYLGVTQQGATAVLTYSVAFNGYDTIGNDYLSADGFDGDMGAVIIVSGVISGGDLAKLYKWSQGRFGVA